MKSVAIILCTLIFFSCRDNVPAGILPPAKMEAVFWDYVIADEYANKYLSQDSTRNAALENVRMQLAIFKKHNISRKEFYDSYSYYQTTPKKFRIMLDSIEARAHRSDTGKVGKTIIPYE